MRFSHPFFNLYRVKISKGVNVGERSEEGEGGDTKPGISAILAATRNPYYFTPRPIPHLAPALSPSLLSRSGEEGLLAEAATCRGVEKLQLSLTQRGENGSFFQDPFWTPRQVRRVGAWGPVHAGATTVALAGGSALRWPVCRAPALGCCLP